MSSGEAGGQGSASNGRGDQSLAVSTQCVSWLQPPDSGPLVRCLGPWHKGWELAKLPHLSEPGSGRGKDLAASACWLQQVWQVALPALGCHRQGGRCEAALSPSLFVFVFLCSQTPLTWNRLRGSSRRRQGCRFETPRLLLPLRAISDGRTFQSAAKVFCNCRGFRNFASRGKLVH